MHGRLTCNNSPAFVDRKELIGSRFANRLLDPAGPLDLDGRVRILAQAERHCEIALRTITGAAVYGASLRAKRTLKTNRGANAVAITFCSSEAHRQPVVAITAVVPEQIRGPVVG